jgi:predicted nucleic acid-binding Zn ribbon protein
MQRKCLHCSSDLLGRVDKKFCDDQCRNAYHNEHKRNDSAYIKRVNKILIKNRGILMQLNPTDKSKVNRSKLNALGFDFNYYTNTYTTKAGAVYYFCYEKGYLPLENEWYALVTNLDVQQ